MFDHLVRKYYLKFFVFIFLGLLALVTVDIIQVIIPDILGKLVDNISTNTTKEYILSQVKIIFIVAFATFFCRFMWRLMILGFGSRVESEIRVNMHNKALKLPQSYYKKNSVGQVLSLFTNDLPVLKTYYSNGYIMIIDFLVLGTVILYKMFMINYLLTIIILLPSIILAIVSYLLSKIASKKFLIRQKSYEDLTSYIQESITFLPIIRAFAKEDEFTDVFFKKDNNHKNNNVRFVKITILINVIITFTVGLITLIILFLGGFLNLKTMGISTGKLVTFLALFSILTWPITAIGQFLSLASQAKTSRKRINDFLNIKIDDCITNNIKPAINGNIVFKNVSFKYDDSNSYLLQNINISINQGEFVFILGDNGSGKSTIIDLLLRFIPSYTGDILLDDNNLLDIDNKYLRDNIAYVPQVNFLFSDSISKNVTLDENIDINFLKDISSVSCFHENVINFNDGYDTILEECGKSLSGGQRQRLSITRALFKKSPVMLLDDPFSALDVKTEKNLIKNLKEYRKNCTTIVFSHRITNYEMYDKIIVIKDNKILMQGKHIDLIKNAEYLKILNNTKGNGEVYE